MSSKEWYLLLLCRVIFLETIRNMKVKFLYTDGNIACFDRKRLRLCNEHVKPRSYVSDTRRRTRLKRLKRITFEDIAHYESFSNVSYAMYFKSEKKISKLLNSTMFQHTKFIWNFKLAEPYNSSKCITQWNMKPIFIFILAFAYWFILSLHYQPLSLFPNSIPVRPSL